MTTTRICVRLDRETVAELSLLAEVYQHTVSGLIRTSIRHLLRHPDTLANILFNCEESRTSEPAVETYLAAPLVMDLTPLLDDEPLLLPQ